MTATTWMTTGGGSKTLAAPTAALEEGRATLAVDDARAISVEICDTIGAPMAVLEA
jgi:hypothetical protein